MKKLTLASSIIIAFMVTSSGLMAQETDSEYNPYTDPDNILYDEGATEETYAEDECTEENPCGGDETISNGGFYTTTFPSEQFLGRFELADAIGIEDAAFNDIEAGLQWLNMDAFLIPGTSVEEEFQYMDSRRTLFRAPTTEEFLALINNMTVSGSDPHIDNDYAANGYFSYFDDGLTAQLSQYLFSGSNYTYDNSDIFFFGPNGMDMSVYQGSLNDPIYFSAGLYSGNSYVPPNALSMLVRTIPSSGTSGTSGTSGGSGTTSQDFTADEPSDPVTDYGMTDPIVTSSGDFGGSQSVDVNTPLALSAFALLGLSFVRRRRIK